MYRRENSFKLRLSPRACRLFLVLFFALVQLSAQLSEQMPYTMTAVNWTFLTLTITGTYHTAS